MSCYSSQLVVIEAQIEHLLKLSFRLDIHLQLKMLSGRILICLWQSFAFASGSALLHLSCRNQDHSYDFIKIQDIGGSS
ncbi:hypothetical protein P8452_44966 [Trifolium repens]|nr:hypothetical protein P8452_44966 [Trifolium repens]